jgi:hypothetical protein
VSLVAWFQTVPGYMDADYYYAGGLRLVQGHGFTETFLWNYLDSPQSLPHPSHGYWFPFASMLAAFGMWVTGLQTFFAARLGFILVAALIPPVTASLAYSLTSRRDIALISGLLAVFPTYQAPFLPTTDNFGLFMLFGGLFFILFPRTDKKSIFLLGLVAGLMNLSRSDGLLWLAVGLFGIFLNRYGTRPRNIPFLSYFFSLLPAYFLLIIPFLAGYLLIMTPWFIRNLTVFGTPLTPAGSRVLWMTQYDDTFAYPATRINLQNWLAAGWQSALAGRWWAFKLNFSNMIAVQGGIVLLPFILIGLWQLRADLRVRLGALVWLGLFALMTLVFPFAGARGSFIHAGAAFQPLWWAVAPIGLDFLVLKARQRGWFTPQAFRLFRLSLVAIMAALTFSLVYIRVIQTDWAEFDRAYRHAEQILVQNGASPQDTVVAANAPGYFSITGRAAITVPAENPAVLQELSQKFGARFLVLEKNYLPDPFTPVFESPENQPGLEYLSGFDNVRVFAILPGK